MLKRATRLAHPYTTMSRSPGKDVAAVVAALNRNVQAGVSDLAASLEQYFAAHPASPARRQARMIVRGSF